MAIPESTYDSPAMLSHRGHPIPLIGSSPEDIASSLVVVTAARQYVRLRDQAPMTVTDGEPTYALPANALCLPLANASSFALLMLGVADGGISFTGTRYLELDGRGVHLGLPARSPYGSAVPIALTPLDPTSPYGQPYSAVGLAIAAMQQKPALTTLQQGFFTDPSRQSLRQLRQALIDTLVDAALTPPPPPIRPLSPLTAPLAVTAAVNLADLMALGDSDDDEEMQGTKSPNQEPEA
ncbi:hypothetical protein PLESTM_001754600 [Pleodorina starrii]|nr:hypothetical protein PLESTM_001754600 [Pleodorina starrii]